MKGISPLIATVLLAIITVGAAVFLWHFFNSYISFQTSNIPDICMNTIELKCSHNNTHINTCVLQHKAGKKSENVTIDFICLDKGKNLTKMINVLDVGNIITENIEFECTKTQITIIVAGICEGFKDKQIFYECRGIKCLYS